MKKVLIVLMSVLVVSMSFTACNNKNDVDEEPPKNNISENGLNETPDNNSEKTPEKNQEDNDESKSDAEKDDESAGDEKDNTSANDIKDKTPESNNEVQNEQKKPEIEKLDDKHMLYDGYAFEKNEYDKAQADYAVTVMNNVISRLLKGNNVYLSILPDKNYQVMKMTGGDVSGYTLLVSNIRNGVSSAKYIDTLEMLTLDSYYKTDAHWKQECIVDIANKLVTTMNPSAGVSSVDSYTVKEINGFSGTYLKSGKANLAEETLKYLDGGAISSMTATCLNNSGKFAALPIYSEAKMSGAEEYDFFLGGAQTIVTIDNPNAVTDKELVVFRDSFGSSIAPLVAQGYKKTTFVDLRYIVPDLLPSLVNFENSDVLFLYSANILNNGRILKNFMK